MENGLNNLENVLFVVLLYKNEKFNVRAPYDIEIMGKKMWEWVALAGNGANIKTIPCTKDSDVVSLIKQFVKNEKYAVALYSDTPLVTKSTILEILEYFKQKDLSVLKFKRGFVFDCEYLLNCDRVLCDSNPLFDSDEFEAVEDFVKLAKVTEEIRNRILNFHMQNGVQILDFNSTYIDCDVVIEVNVVIYPNNHISGNSYIGEYVKLFPNNVIKNSIISNGAVLKGAYVVESRISENAIIEPFEKVIDCDR